MLKILENLHDEIIMASSSSVRIEVLNKGNYDTWKIQMEALLLKNDAWAYVCGEISKPIIVEGDAASIEAVKKWEIEDKKARSDIILSVSPSELKLIKGCDTSREVWQKLESVYQSKGPARKATLLKQLTLHRMNDGDDIREHIRKFFDTVDKLNEMDIEINADLLTIMLLYSLPPSFENFRCAIESRDTLPSPEALRVKVLEENEARRNETLNNETNAMIAKKHYENRRNPSKKGSAGEKSRDEKAFKFKCHRCKKVGHKAIECNDSRGKTDKVGQATNVSLYAGRTNEWEALIAKNASHVENWCIDSGCTTHLCKNLNNFTEITGNDPGTLNLANNVSTKINAKGSVKFKATTNGQSKNVTLNEALHVPDLRMNLLSVGKVADKGFKITFEKDFAEIIDRNGKSILKADRVNGLYLLRQEKPKIDSNVKEKFQERANHASINSWHRRMGHLNFKDLLNSHRKGNVLGINLNSSKEHSDYETCIRGKMSSPSQRRVKENQACWK